MFNKEFYYAFLKYLFIFIIFYILHNATIQGLQPFAFGMLFALIWCNQKILVLAPLYIIAGLLVSCTVPNVLVMGIMVLIFSLFYLLHKRFNKSLNVVLILCYGLLSQVGLIYFAWLNNTLWGAFVTLVIGLITMYANLYFLQSIITQGLKRKYTINEGVSGGIVLFSLGVGLISIPYGKYLFLGILLLLLLIMCYTYGTSQGIIIGSLLSLGASCAIQDLFLLAQTIILALGISATISNKRIFSSLAAILLSIIIGLYFYPNYDIYLLGVSILASLTFLIIPKKFFNILSNIVISSKGDFTAKEIVLRNKQFQQKRILELSRVFAELKSVFTQMVRGKLDFADACVYLTKEVQQRCCMNCIKKDECLRLRINENKENIVTLVNFCYQRGKVSMIDVASKMASSCVRLSFLLNVVNNIVAEYKSYNQTMSNQDCSRLMIAEQMLGVSNILKNLSQEVMKDATFDELKENLIKDELMSVGIICKEVIVQHLGAKHSIITIMLKNDTASNQHLIKILSNIMQTPMEITATNTSSAVGYEILTLENSPHYEVVFGSAGATKDGSKKSGDTHSIMKINRNKVLLALCDGMGSGVSACKTSTLAINLLENFYKAGFDNELILSNVNKLLAMGGEETFTALDIALIDLQNCICDLIKVGAPLSFIKRKETTLAISQNAMPLGILEELIPNIKSMVLVPNDMIVLVTDGIIDAFNDVLDLQNLINHTKTTNPQTLADTILDKAMQLSQNIPQDDMTVLVVKIFAKI